MNSRRHLTWTAFLLALGAGEALAQGLGPLARLQRPYSIVDEAEGSNVFGPPPTPPAGGYLSSNYVVRSGSLTIGDGWPEDYQWIEPVPLPTQPVPLLVVFHKFGTSQLDMTVFTGFPQEVGNQGWFAVCPLAANPQHFASIPSQVHTEAVILDMLNRYPLIDRTRIYGVGFSMGGGSVTNYAARHLDPAKPMLAATIAMSGGFALKHTYYADPPARQYLDFWFGTNSPGSADPFKMARSSVINFDPITSQVYAGEDLARNLTHVPLQILRASDEKIAYQPQACDVMAAHMQSLGVAVGSKFDYQFVPFGVDAYDHRWSMMDYHWACEWLKTKTLALPTSASTLADRDDVYFHFFVEQDAPNAFTPFQWAIDVPNNALHLSGTANLRRLTVDTLGAGLNPGQRIAIDLSTADGLSDEVVFTSVPAVPTGVTRDGNATTSWSYNSTTHEVTLIETDGQSHSWLIAP